MEYDDFIDTVDEFRTEGPFYLVHDHLLDVFEGILFIKRNRFIFLNNSLDENMLRIVCAHELGHDQLHRNMAKTTPIHEFMLYDMKSKPEYEANIVAAEILMDSDEVLRYIYEYGYTAEQISSAMSTDINLVALNVAHLATLGYNLHALEHKSNFLK